MQRGLMKRPSSNPRRPQTKSGVSLPVDGTHPVIPAKDVMVVNASQSRRRIFFFDSDCWGFMTSNLGPPAHGSKSSAEAIRRRGRVRVRFHGFRLFPGFHAIVAGELPRDGTVPIVAGEAGTNRKRLVHPSRQDAQAIDNPPRQHRYKDSAKHPFVDVCSINRQQ